MSRKPSVHQVRIIGGQYRRTPIAVVDQPGLRPTPDRVRETLFNWLTHLWDGDFGARRVLDLFAGTGALGLEAASRGAGSVVFVEPDRHAVENLRQLCHKLKATQTEVRAGTAATYLAGYAGAPFDLVLLDPPFDDDWLTRTWPTVPAVLGTDGLVYVESASPFRAPEGFIILRQAKAGAVHYHLLSRASGAPED